LEIRPDGGVDNAGQDAIQDAILPYSRSKGRKNSRFFVQQKSI
jgi:hypothetical protein